MDFEDKLKQMVYDKSALVEFVSWQDNAGEENYAYLLMDGKDYPQYKKAVSSGTLVLEDWGMFHKGKGHPSQAEKDVIKNFFGEENLKVNI